MWLFLQHVYVIFTNYMIFFITSRNVFNKSAAFVTRRQFWDSSIHMNEVAEMHVYDAGSNLFRCMEQILSCRNVITVVNLSSNWIINNNFLFSLLRESLFKVMCTGRFFGSRTFQIRLLARGEDVNNFFVGLCI